MRVLAATQGVNACIKRIIALTSIYGIVQNKTSTPTFLKYCHEHRRPYRGRKCLSRKQRPRRCFEKLRHGAAFNNYGNVLREMGDAEGAIPFLQRSIQLIPNAVTPNFNLAVAYLLAGDYARGWPQYEHRWNFEHLAGTLPKYTQPRWAGTMASSRRNKKPS